MGLPFLIICRLNHKSLCLLSHLCPTPSNLFFINPRVGFTTHHNFIILFYCLKFFSVPHLHSPKHTFHHTKSKIVLPVSSFLLPLCVLFPLMEITFLFVPLVAITTSLDSAEVTSQGVNLPFFCILGLYIKNRSQ